nr:MAG TPA: hypothetical protein [Caudoviricetes sp.]
MQSGDCILCNDLRKYSYFQEKSEKKVIFCLKYFAGFKNCRTFASHLRNKDAYLANRNPYNNASFFVYLHVSVIMKRLLFAAVILFTDSANVR